LSELRKYRQFSPEQKTEIVLAGLRGDRSVREVCREHQIAEILYYQWRERLLDGGRTAVANPRERSTGPRAALSSSPGRDHRGLIHGCMCTASYNDE
jgi:transposase-like protein